MDTQELLDLKRQIDDAKIEIQQLEGRKKYLLQQLQKDWGCKTVGQANKKLMKMKEDINEMERKVNKGISELQEKYDIE